MWTKITKDLNYDEMLQTACLNPRMGIGDNPWFILKVGKMRFLKLVFEDYIYDGED